MFLLKKIIYTLIILLPVILSISFLTLAERKLIAAVQRREGPSVVGFFGVLQPFADGLKLVIKEIIFPIKSNLFLFFLAPVLTFVISFFNWIIIPYNHYSFFSDNNVSLLFILGTTSFEVYGIILAGWASNSKYAFLGSLRTGIQMLSYEIFLGLILVPLIFLTGSLRLNDIVQAQNHVWFIFILLPLGIIFFISILAETNRAPFDLPEAEAELVAGYNVEYSSITFALFFLGEYCNIILMSVIFVIFFLGGWQNPLILKTLYKKFTVFLIFKDQMFNLKTINCVLDSGYAIIISHILIYNIIMSIIFSKPIFFLIKIFFIIFMFIFIRANFPRYRYDQLIYIGWKIFLPFTLGYFLFILGFFSIFYWGMPFTEQLPFTSTLFWKYYLNYPFV